MKVRNLRWRFYQKKGGPRQIGNRCSVYCRGCICCDSYMFFYTRGRFGSFDEVRAAYPDAWKFEELPWAEAVAKNSLQAAADVV